MQVQLVQSEYILRPETRRTAVVVTAYWDEHPHHKPIAIAPQLNTVFEEVVLDVVILLRDHVDVTLA